MFLTFPSFRLASEPRLLGPGGEIWKAFELATQHTWFIAQTRAESPGEPAVAQTCLLAYDQDVVALVQTMSARRVVDICAMEPPWITGEKGWRARPVRELWVGRIDDRRAIVFVDQAGEAFCGDIAPCDPARVVDRHLIAQIDAR